jgi:hypothetical protein
MCALCISRTVLDANFAKRGMPTVPMRNSRCTSRLSRMDTKGFDLRSSILRSAAVISSPVLLALGTMAFAATAHAQPGRLAAGRQAAVSPAQARGLSGDVTSPASRS